MMLQNLMENYLNNKTLTVYSVSDSTSLPVSPKSSKWISEDEKLKKVFNFESTKQKESFIIEVLKYAKSRGIYSIGFLGGDGGGALAYCNNAFIVPSESTARIQESHITAGHTLLQYVEDKLIHEGFLNKE